MMSIFGVKSKRLLMKIRKFTLRASISNELFFTSLAKVISGRTENVNKRNLRYYIQKYLLEVI